ncbi:MAG TPA: hypothetical protein VLU25_22465, partial [Acidobacteriota bacterium]|nr:hypothetical protein [Acidobacteriota bacterium]HSR70706.1 hypothetical protein [Acidobacteriota bacterium]
TLLGLVLGLAASWALSSFISDMLYQVGSFDLPTVAAVTLTLLTVALAAILIPTLRATRVDPVTALREE